MVARKTGASRSGARKGAAPVAAATGADPALTALIDVAADYYWEQDASYRFTVWRATRPAQGHARATGELLGKTSAELCAAPGGDPEHWVRHRALLEGREPFRDVMHVLAARGGPSHHLILSGAPAYAPNGEFLGYRGVARDGSGLIRMERLLDLEGKWVRGLEGADDLASVLPLILSLTCEFARFSYGCYWSVDQQSRALHRVAGCGASSAARSVLVAGEPAPDWLEAEPVWLAGDADGAAWSSALVVPVAAGGSIMGSSSSARPRRRRRTPGSCTCCAASRCSSDICTPARPRPSGCARARAGSRRRWRSRRSASRTSTTKAVSLRETAAMRDARLQRARAAGAHRQGNLAPRRRGHAHELAGRLRKASITSFKAEKRYIRKNGSVVWAGLTVALKRDRDRRKLYDVSIVEDISARKEAEECIHYLANHDPLTGLPNRARFSHLLNVGVRDGAPRAAQVRRAVRRTSIASRSSTTRSAKKPATPCCVPLQRACGAASEERRRGAARQ